MFTGSWITVTNTTAHFVYYSTYPPMQNVVFDPDAVPIILQATKGVDSIPIILDPKVGCKGNNDFCTHRPL